MSDELTYHYEKIASSTEAIDTFIRTMNARVEDLESTIKSELLPTWEGEAQTAYHTQQQKWRGAMSKISDILGQVKVSVNQGAENMNLSDKKWAQAFEG